ncbi:PEP-CTERM sorting domain-containing protein [Poriferisphaera sp. WC338]|uniref:PEP-CTERM sorting domain-containing protein n=1 Tax=Poriferisphaera sp. WC338 TaxID=3425129 RepID=UPI003D819002
MRKRESIIRMGMSMFVAAGALLITSEQIIAAPIAIDNASFQDNDITSFDGTLGGDWVESEGHGFGILLLHNDQDPLNAFDGDQYAALSNRSTPAGDTNFSQKVLTAGIVNGTTYTLSAYFRRINASQPEDGAISFGFSDGTAVLATYNFDGTTNVLSHTAWVKHSVSFTATTANAGDDLYIAFQNASSSGASLNRVFIDAVSLEATPIPEPATLSLGLVGLGLLMKRKRIN